jgi:predicted permease
MRIVDTFWRWLRPILWLESSCADIVFGWRQLMKRKTTSAAAVLSLGLAIGACTAAFRLIDALLLRPLPVAAPERFYAVTRSGTSFEGRGYAGENCWSYPAFREMRTAVKDQAELLAVSYAQRDDLTFQSDQEMEKGWVEYVSGWMFDTFGLRPTLGRLLTEEDDLKPDAHPYAVISHDYWARRFGRDPQVIGRTFRLYGKLYEIVGVAPESFTGTEPGTVIDIFLPTMMNSEVTNSGAAWIRTFAQVRPGIAVGPIRAKLHALSGAFEAERAKEFKNMPQEMIDRRLNQTVLLESAAAGASAMQRDYCRSLLVLGALAALVLLIACANVSNLLAAQATARAREMALRVSIGAGRGRLMRLVLAESMLLALLAAAVGALFAGWAAPLVVSTVNPPDNPVRLALPTDWRVLGFGLTLTFAVMLLFGLAPALRASGVKPASALKGGENPHSRHRLMHGLIAAQTAFCFLVLFVAGLFIATFDRLSNRPTGFSADRLLTLETVAHSAQPPAVWDQVTEHLRVVPGVETVALAGKPMLDGRSMIGTVSINGAPPASVFVYFLNVSPGWLEAMKISIIEGRDFRAGDASPKVAIVNQAFAKQFFTGESPVGESFERNGDRYEVVGLVADAACRNLRDPIPPQAYFPFVQPTREGTFIVRASGRNPQTLASIMRREVTQARSDFRVSNIRTQLEINQAHTVRERLLARLGLFFGLVALLLSGVGIYGVLDYSVLQRRREIGIRMALGAQRWEVLSWVVGQGMRLTGLGAVVGLTAAFAMMRLLASLLYEVEPTDPATFAGVTLLIVSVALLACYLPARRAARVDPMAALRCE